MRIKSYSDMRKEGLCTNCGKQNPTSDKSLCPECARKKSEQKKIRYEYLKRIGKCIRCGKNTAEPGKAMCLECAGKESDDYYLKYREQKLENQKIYARKRTEYRRDNELCLTCGKRHAKNGLCNVCKGYQKRYRKNNRNDISRSERALYGICYICGKNPTVSGKGVCKECYSIRLEAMGKCINSNHCGFNDYWKRENKLIFKG